MSIPSIRWRLVPPQSLHQIPAIPIKCWVDLQKALQHRYTRKYKKNGRWMYVYPDKKGGKSGSRHDDDHHLSAKKHQVEDHHVHEGASFSLGGGKGHAVITHVDPKTGDVTFFNDDVDGKGGEGKPQTMSRKAFDEMVHGSHSEAVARKYEAGLQARKDILEKAKRYGTEKHVARAEAELDKWNKAHGKGEAKSGEYRGDIDPDVALDAFKGTSHTPEGRVKATLDSYEKTLISVKEKLEEAGMGESFPGFRDAYKKKTMDWLRSRSGAVSGHVAGWSKFKKNSNKQFDREKKYLDALSNLHKETLQNIEEEKKRRQKDKRNTLEFVPEEQIQELRKKLDSAIEAQELRKKINRIVRRKSKSDEQKRTEVSALFKDGIDPKLEEYIFRKKEGKMGFHEWDLQDGKVSIIRLRKKLDSVDPKGAIGGHDSAATSNPDASKGGQSAKTHEVKSKDFSLNDVSIGDKLTFNGKTPSRGVALHQGIAAISKDGKSVSIRKMSHTRTMTGKNKGKISKDTLYSAATVDLDTLKRASTGDPGFYNSHKASDGETVFLPHEDGGIQIHGDPSKFKGDVPIELTREDVKAVLDAHASSQKKKSKKGAG